MTNTVVRRLPQPLKVMDRSKQKAVSPAIAKQIVEGRVIDTSKIYKRGASPTVPPLPHKLTGIIPHSVGGDASNTVPGPASISELARALKNDPQLMFEWVHNNIDWEPGWGVQKGAFGALVDGRGNSFDQSALLVTLLRTAGFTANYVLGTIQINAAQAGDWFGTVSDNIDMANQYCFYSYIPVDYIYNPIEDAYDITLGHVWVQCVIGGTTYVFDPSRKSYNRTAALLDLSNLASTMGYNPTTFLTAARSGATIDPSGNYVQNINQANIDSNLVTLSTTLATWMKTNHPGATLDDILGGASIIPATLPVLQTSLPYELAGDVPTVWTGDIPVSYKTTFQLSWPDANIDQTFTSDQLCGARLTIWWTSTATGSTPTLYLDGTAIQTGTEIPNWMFVTYPNYVVVHNAYHDTNANENAWIGIDSNVKHLLATVWGNPGRGAVSYHQSQLVANSAAGGAADSENIYGETLALIWSTQCAEFTAINDIMSRLLLVRAPNFHGVAVVTYNDVRPGIGIASYLGTQVATDYSFLVDRRAGGVYGMIGSGLECAIFQQVVGNIPSINTGAMIRAENAAGGKIYQGTQSNWTTVIEPALWANGYTSTDTNDIYNNFVNWGGGATVEIPQHRNVALGSASGYGFWFWPNGTAQGPGGIVNFTKGGGGGNSQTPGDQNDKGKDKDDPSKKQPPKDKTNDPIDVFSGDFLYTRQDLKIGSQAEPFSLSFQRSYNSRNRHIDGPLGLGWTHNFNITAKVNSDPFLALGQQTALPVVATLAAFFVIMDLCSGDVNVLPLDQHVTASLCSSWWVDQVTNNIVDVRFDDGTHTFTKLPDGSYVNSLTGPSNLTLVGGLFVYTTPDKIKYNFNSAGQITSVVYPSGMTVSYSYAGGLLQSVSNGLTRTLTLHYTSGRLTSVTDGTGRSVQYSVDGSKNLTSFTDANSKVFTYQYDQPGRMTKYFLPANPAVAIVTNNYDSLSRVQTQTNSRSQVWTYYFAGSRTEETDPLGKSTIKYLNKFGSTLREINALGQEIKNEFDGLGRMIKATQPEGNSVQWVFDNFNNPLSITKVPKTGSGLSNIVNSFTYHPTYNKVATATDGNGNVTTFTYDPSTGNLLTVQKPTVGGLTPQVTYTYNARGQILTITDETGVVTQHSYDTTTELLNTTIIDPGISPHLALTASFGYDPVGNTNSITDPNGNVWTATYNPNRMVSQFIAPAPFGYVTNRFYDDNGNPTSEQRQTGGVPAWAISSFTYSTTGKQLSKTDPSGNTTSWTYDSKDRVQTMSDGQGRLSQYSYDELDRLFQVIDPGLALSESRTYTTNGILASVTDARNNTTQFTYDGLDRISKTIYADTTFEQNQSYDLNSNILVQLTRSGNTITMTYDALNRLSTKTPQSQGVVTLTYDLAGRMVKANKPIVAGDPSTGDFQYFFDTAGRFYKEQYPDSKIVLHQLDSNGNRTKTTWPDSYFVSRSFDQLNRLSNIKLNGASSPAVQFTYDQLSRKTLVTFGNGASTSFTPQLNDDITQIAHTFVGSSLTFTYGFNGEHQVTNEQVSNTSFVAHPASAGNTSYGTSTPDNRYPTVGGATYTYDGNKNLSGDSVWTYTFDTENHLLTANKTGVSASFVYDPSHRQSQKTVGAVKTRFIYDGWQRIADYNAVTNALQNRYVYGQGLDEALVQISSSGALTFCHSNRVGTITAISGSSGSLTNTNVIDNFGQVSAMGGTDFGLAGQRYDAETGLYYFKHRYYSPIIGRFLQPDYLRYADGLNLYTHAHNDPINNTDPLGLLGVGIPGLPSPTVIPPSGPSMNGVPCFFGSQPTISATSTCCPTNEPTETHVPPGFTNQAGHTPPPCADPGSQGDKDKDKKDPKPN
ncbi:MAG: hypothetical protein JST89_13905 [Cyanobacteria bacterium SZAS-4]|nr:hypothetical protein [Cyanobacteria bacterium SZAS-4]